MSLIALRPSRHRPSAASERYAQQGVWYDLTFDHTFGGVNFRTPASLFVPDAARRGTPHPLLVYHDGSGVKGAPTFNSGTGRWTVSSTVFGGAGTVKSYGLGGYLNSPQPNLTFPHFALFTMPCRESAESPAGTDSLTGLPVTGDNAIDYPGIKGFYLWENVEADLAAIEAVKGAFAIDAKRVHYLGYSFGATLGQLMAAAYADTFASFVLSAGTIVESWPALYDAGAVTQWGGYVWKGLDKASINPALPTKDRHRAAQLLWMQRLAGANLWIDQGTADPRYGDEPFGEPHNGTNDTVNGWIAAGYAWSTIADAGAVSTALPRVYHKYTGFDHGNMGTVTYQLSRAQLWDWIAAKRLP